MVKVTAEEIKKLREATGVGMQDAQKILVEAGGDMAKAQELLRKKGLATAAKKSSRTAAEGVVEAYVHGGKVGVLVEVNCETDFVAKTVDFKNFVHELALQIAAMSPLYIARTDVPAELAEKERQIYREQVAGQKKPAEIVERVINGKLDKFYEEVCLLEQPSIKEPKIKVAQMLTDVITKVGENVVVNRFVRYALGEK